MAGYTSTPFGLLSMNGSPGSSVMAPRSPVLRLWVAILFVVVAQLAFIFRFGERTRIRARPPEVAPSLEWIGGGCSGLLQLIDPTLFALPHEQGFSGQGWLNPPPQEIHPFAWSEPPRWLPLAAGNLGLIKDPFAAQPGFEPLAAAEHPEPDPLAPHFPQASYLSRTPSVRITDSLAGRELHTSLNLPSWPGKELVSNSVVQVVVDAAGLPFSTVLLERSGNEDADRYALAEARKLRFKPLAEAPHTRNVLNWGTLIFEWQTTPIGVTNNLPGGR